MNITIKGIKNLGKSLTVKLTALGMALYLLVDMNPDGVANLLVYFLPYSVEVIIAKLNNYNTIILFLTLIGTGTGRLRTDEIDIPLDER